ncbi:LysR family transcriptional regulator [Caulobacter sp. BP25]|uniref:LysR family transcriptional regulator n=1 Tax=Caulobacter sp. BP25 TaxID=2048900 RepID=UPI000C12CFAD|nr:LysR family transcriptional regulator [Caulobacter sp. BP25]PHY17576.1 LysR family transcriptional regulator [Caulobacter sp. BP25]
MERADLADLTAFMAVADERSFTRAAARLGTSQSALSQAVRRLETRLAVSLLTRTTRSVAPTEAGERLLDGLRPALDQIDSEISALSELRDTPSGTVRITAGRHAAKTVLMPALRSLVRKYPDIKVELSADSSLRDIVADRFDAGVRLGEQLAADMIAVRIGPDLRMLAVGSPDYFARYGSPQTPHDLTRHNCVNIRFPTVGGLYVWEFEKDGQELHVRVDGQFVLNDMELVVEAARAGCGLAYVLESEAQALIAAGELVTVLEDWTPPFAGYHLYYPSRRQTSPAFKAVIDALRYREPR